jgi:hypothetical protein
MRCSTAAWLALKDRYDWIFGVGTFCSCPTSYTLRYGYFIEDQESLGFQQRLIMKVVALFPNTRSCKGTLKYMLVPWRDHVGFSATVYSAQLYISPFLGILYS